LTFVIDEPIFYSSGLIAVARLTQGISPKHCKSARLPGKGLLAKCLISPQVFRLEAALGSGLSTTAR
jgi:hypothetical protein